MNTDYVYLKMTSPELFFKRAKEATNFAEFGVVQLSYTDGVRSKHILRLSKRLDTEHIILVCDAVISDDIRNMKTDEQLKQLRDELVKKVEGLAKDTWGETKIVDGQFSLEG